ncbi:MAG: DUF5009 domain-containing protein [Verrucomicrobiales bacterium]|nr:DUF5009 domain-containing protein [Verrucomicrobiales bacterium]
MSEQTAKRLVSLDTYRGLVLVLLAFECVNYGWQHVLAETHPSGLTRFIEFHASHIAWAGCSFWDLIQPSFMFMVGVSMAYSYGKRKRLGDGFREMLSHAVIRALVLILLGVFLRTSYMSQTNWTFEDVITQIGLGYVPLFLLWNRSARTQIIAIAAILIGYWLLFAVYPIKSPAGYDWENPQAHLFTGFLQHWNINANPAHAFDTWFLNLFPRETVEYSLPSGETIETNRFLFHPEGYNTLNFIPSLAIMVMGLMAGELLRSDRSDKVKQLAIYGIGGIILGTILHFTGICPLVKKTWTPSFTLFSGGWCLLILLGLYYLIDIKGWKKWTFPFVVVGMNSIAMYVMLWLTSGWINETLQKHLGEGYAGFFGPGMEPLMQNLLTGVVLWLICFWMYRRKLFLRI